MRILAAFAVAAFLYSCGSEPLHEKCTRENAVDRALSVTWAQSRKTGGLPSGWNLSELTPSYSAVQVNGDVFAVQDTAHFTTRHLDSTMSMPFRVVLKCAFDGKMEPVESSIGTPVFTVDVERLEARLKEERFNDSLSRIDLRFN